MSSAPTSVSPLPSRWWWGFVPYIVVSTVHIAARFAEYDPIAAPTKLALMPLLAVAVIWAGRGSAWGTTYRLLFLAIAFSWLGDGAGAFFPGAPTLPLMLLFFGLAHLCYIWIFWKQLAVRRFPVWALVYVLWWVVMVAVLWPVLGGLAVAVALYGVVLGGTAASASRCHPLIAWGGAFFLASDTILAFRLFTPDAMPDWTSGMVMLTYCIGQGLLAAGIVIADRLTVRAAAALEQEVVR